MKAPNRCHYQGQLKVTMDGLRRKFWAMEDLELGIFILFSCHSTQVVSDPV